MERIVFNKPFFAGDELEYIRQAVENGVISGNGPFTKKCQAFLEAKYGFRKTLLTASCTDALEMAALLCDIRPGDEVIAPSFTFVSSVNAFVLRGADIVFCDTRADFPCIDERAIEGLITSRTRAIVVTHYAGIACQMEVILATAERHGLFVVEDAAHGINSYFKGRPLGGIGHFGAFSFHETKNIIAGEGGMLAVNDVRFAERAEIIQEKGTDRSKYFRGEIDKYSWVDIGSSFLPSDITAAFLFGQLMHVDDIQSRRLKIWRHYYEGLLPLQKEGKIRLPVLPEYATNNAHLFYVVTASKSERDGLIAYLGECGIMAVFHYTPLHRSPYYLKDHPPALLTHTECFSDCLVRLPLYFGLEEGQIGSIVDSVKSYFDGAE